MRPSSPASFRLPTLSQALVPERLVGDDREVPVRRRTVDSHDGRPRRERAACGRIEGMPDDAVRELVPDAHTAIVALTHDPKLDDMALIEALQSGAFYVGALGSRRNQQVRKQRLAEHFDLSSEQLARLHGPVGLALGAKTPAEIAVTIVAEIVQVKNLVTGAVASTVGCALP